MIDAQESLEFRQAAQAGNIDVLKALYSKYGKDIVNEAGPKSGKTALHQAVLANRLDVINLLLAWGANSACCDNKGFPAITYAIENRHDQAAIAIITHSDPYKPNVVDNIKQWLRNKSRTSLDAIPSNIRYHLPPLVFLMSHNDPATFRVVSNNFESLYQLGYRAVCFEYDETNSFETVQAKFISDILLLPEEKMESIRIGQFHHNFLDKAHSTGFKYHGIDANLGKEERAPDSEFTSNDLGMAYRNSIMAHMTTKFAYQYHGGIIVVAGAGHAKFSKNLEKMNGNSISPYCFYNIATDVPEYRYDSNFASLTRQQCLTQGAGMTCMSTKNSNDHELKKSLFSPIERFLGEPVSEMHYEDTVDTSLINRLKQINQQCIGLKRYSDTVNGPIVDAAIPVHDINHYLSEKAKLCSRIPAAYTTLTFARQKNKTAQLMLTIRDINGGSNQKAIAKI